jgi:hypothetical protein
METGLKKSEIINLIAQSHVKPPKDAKGRSVKLPDSAKFDAYKAIVQAVAEDPEFVAHLIAWNFRKGQVRDSKIALPVLALAVRGEYVFTDNALAHLALLPPRDLARALRYGQMVPGVAANRIRMVIKACLRELEADWPRWERAAVQHRLHMRELYAKSHLRPSPTAKAILFESQYPKGSTPYPAWTHSATLRRS